MLRTGFARGATALLLIAGLGACAAGPRQPSYPVPDQPGIYSLSGKSDLRRLDGDPNWEASTWPDRANLPADVQFVVNDPALANRAPGSAIELWRVAWVRSEINASNQAMPISGPAWDVAPIAPYDIPFRYDSPPNKPSVVRITPSVPLAPGLYALRVTSPSARQARLGVGWNSLDQRQYSALNCVDRYVAEGNVYRPCNAAQLVQPLAVVPTDTVIYSPGVSVPAGTLVTVPTTTVAAPGATVPGATVLVPATGVPMSSTVSSSAMVPATLTPSGLDITLAEPIRHNNGLLLQGTVTNATGQVQLLPALQATLQDASGRDLQRWVFQPAASSLAPGARTAFQTEVRPVQANVANVVVTFAPR